MTIASTNITTLFLQLLAANAVKDGRKEADLITTFYSNGNKNFLDAETSWLNLEESGCHFSVYEPDQCAEPARDRLDYNYLRRRSRGFSDNNWIVPPKRVTFRKKRNALKCKRWLWPKGVVPYQLKIAEPEILRKFEMAKQEIEAVSCVKFLPLDYRQAKLWSKRIGQKYLKIRRSQPVTGESCQASIGRVNARPFINLSTACTKGQILHELMHVLGFTHEHSRPDRDQYVKIHCENILPGMSSDFRKLRPEVMNTFGEPYDFNSIMHYRYNHFSKNGLPTIESLVPEVQSHCFGKMQRLSPTDVKKLNALYPCAIAEYNRNL